MDLIERYTSAVAARLQPVRREAVEAELRAAILDALEARGGTPESEEDVVAVLAELGDPESMAAGYEPGRQYLIGPEHYPFFRRGLRVAMVTIVALSVVAFCISLLMGGLAGYEAGGLLVRTLFYAGMASAAVVVVLVAVFTWIQRAEVPVSRRDWPGRTAWEPRSLRGRAESDPAARFGSVVGLASAAAALVVVGLIGQVAREVEPHASAQLQPLIQGAVSRNVMLLQIGLVVAALAHAVTLVQGAWLSWTRGMRLVADAIALFVFVPLPFRLLRDRSVILESGMTANGVNWLIGNAFVFAVVLAAVMAYHWWRIVRPAKVPVAPPRTSTGALMAATAILALPLSACIISPTVTSVAFMPPPGENAQTSPLDASPRVDEDGRITYRHVAEQASQVILVAEGMEPRPMTRDASGVWSHTSEPMAPDLYLYFFMVDGEPSHDPGNALRVPVVGGGYQSLVHVPSPDAQPWESGDAPAGDLRRLEYHSVRFGESRELWVYTPPGYEGEGAERLPVLYLLHGVGADASAWGTAGRVNFILDNLLGAGEADPMIVVMPLGYGFPDAPSRAGEMLSPATDQRSVSLDFGASLIEEVLPLVEREFRTRTDRGSRAIAGLSMGGSQALHIGLNDPDRFAYVASFGGALIMYGGRYAEWFPGIANSGPGIGLSLHLSVGTEDFLLGVNRHFAGWLAAHGTTASLDEVPGGHTWQTWRRELVRLVPQLFRADSPASLVKTQEDR